VLLTAAAYVLMQEVRAAAAPTSLARTQVTTLRERLLKIGAEVVVSVRRIVLHCRRRSRSDTSGAPSRGRSGRLRVALRPDRDEQDDTLLPHPGGALPESASTRPPDQRDRVDVRPYGMLGTMAPSAHAAGESQNAVATSPLGLMNNRG